MKLICIEICCVLIAQLLLQLSGHSRFATTSNTENTNKTHSNTEMALIREGEGVPDFVLLDELTEDALYKNLHLRYKKNQIYT